jgi:hypothetical protein
VSVEEVYRLEFLFRWIQIFISVGIVTRPAEMGLGKNAQIPKAPRVGFCANLQSEK